MKTYASLAVAVLTIACFSSGAQAQDTLYWDINGADPGAGQIDGFTDGVWGTDDFWSLDPDGLAATGAWVDGSHAVFSAGNDAVDHFIEFAGPQNVASLTIEDGLVTLSGGGGSIVAGTNPVFINQDATLSIPSFLIVTISAGQVLTIDGGTLQNTIVGLGSGIWSGLGTIELTENGGTFDNPNGSEGQYSIMAYTGSIHKSAGTVSATLTKTGAGEQRLRNNNTFTNLNVQEGLLRVDGTAGMETSLGDPTGTVTVAGGAVENTTDGAALGTSLGLTAANASPATRSFVLSGEGATSDSMFVMNASWTINGSISGSGGLMLNGWARNDGGGSTTSIIGSQVPVLQLGGTNTYEGNTTINFGTLAVTGGSAVPNSSRVSFSTRSVWGGNNGGITSTFDTAVLRIDDSETIGSLSGGNSVRGSVNINGDDVVLSVGADNSDATYDGGITGAGGLTKVGTGMQTLTGANVAYTGDTTVEAGTLSISNSYLADAADVYLMTGSTFDLNFGATDVIDSLFLDGVSQAIGTWGAVGNGSADFTSALITGSGLLQVSTLDSGGLIGDYNDDGFVNAADYVFWRDRMSDDIQGYNDWLANFGDSAGSGSAVGVAVPEPASLALAGLALAGLLSLRRRTR